jgi:ubiquinone/menaquinone biosynthesis C-methylase UbiE
MTEEYNPDFFIPENLDHAKNIILTPEDGDTESRWNKETEWTLKTTSALMNITENSLVLDWGCGIGRISKMLIDNYGCKVVGVDLQTKMTDYAKSYVNSDLFSTIKYEDIFNCLTKNKFSHVFSCWVFQHSNKIQYEIPLIYESMDYDSQLFVLEMDKKAIPNKTGGYYDDGINTRTLLETYYDLESIGKIPSHFTTKTIKEMTWWYLLKKKNKI